MAATLNKQRIFSDLISVLPAHTEVPEENGKADAKPVLEEFIYALCRHGAIQEQADRGYRNLGDRFFDWNEIRVSSVREVAEALEDLPGAESKAQRIILFLQEVFETTFSFDLEGLHKKGLKHAAKHLSRYEVADDYAVSWVVQRSLGGHAIPLDEPSLRVLRRLGLVEDSQTELEPMRASMEHQIPKSKGRIFTEALSEFAASTCKDQNPLCPTCPLSSLCMTAELMGVGTETVKVSARSKVR
jgi:endonuclease III